MANVFYLENVGDNVQHTIADVEEQEATQLVTKGKAVEVDFGEYEQFRQKAKQLHSDYKKTEERIKAETNPVYTDEVKQYETEKAFKELEEETARLQSEWQVKVSEMKAEAEKKAATAKVPVTQADRDTAEQVANRQALAIRSAGNEEAAITAIKQAERTINYLSDSEKVALQGQMDNVLNAIAEKSEQFGGGSGLEAKGVLASVQKVDNLDLLADKVAGYIPNFIDTEFRQTKLIKNRRR